MVANYGGKVKYTSHSNTQSRWKAYNFTACQFKITPALQESS